MESDYLILRRASAFRPSGEGNDDDYDVLCNGVVVGRIVIMRQNHGRHASKKPLLPLTTG